MAIDSKQEIVIRAVEHGHLDDVARVRFIMEGIFVSRAGRAVT